MSSLDPLYQLTQPTTPTMAASLPCDPAMNHLYQGASTNMSDSSARDTMTSCDTPRQSLSLRTPVATADVHENLLPHTRNQMYTDIVLCLPSQQTRATASKSRPIPKKRPRKSIALSSQIAGSITRNPQEIPTTFWTLCPTCVMLYEYLNIFLNQEIKCNECDVPFVATKMPAPSKERVLKSLSDALQQNIPHL